MQRALDEVQLAARDSSSLLPLFLLRDTDTGNGPAD